jgi:hypothetical protein
MAVRESFHRFQFGVRHFQIVVTGEHTFRVLRIEEVLGGPENPDGLDLLDRPPPMFASTEAAAVEFGKQRCLEIVGSQD